jgi:hypothetical protein
MRKIVLWTLAIALAIPLAGASPLERKRSPLERMSTERLRATHRDAQAVRESRQDVPARPVLKDFRAIFHAHAEDSAHTGGTRVEMLAEAKLAQVDAIFLANHHRPPTDFITQSWRGLHNGVLFIPGSEARGFLLTPSRSILDRMDDPTPRLLEATRVESGLAFLSHIEERPDHDMAGLDGMEIYNRHADAKKDKAGLAALALRLTDPVSLQVLKEDLRLYPDELFAAEVEYPDDYLAKWDKETSSKRLTGVAANDCHHNQILIVKLIDRQTVGIGTNVDTGDQYRKIPVALRPGLRSMIEGRNPGDILARLDLDPYHRSFRNVSTHILAPELSETALRKSLAEGHVYVSHDWICDPTGFRFEWISAAGLRATMGDEVPFAAGSRIEAKFPARCEIRLIKGGRVVAQSTGNHWDVEINGPGVYRVEGWITLDGEDRGWIYSNPIYVR